MTNCPINNMFPGQPFIKLPVITSGFADRLIQEHGSAQQSIVLTEECSELQKALCKNFRRENKDLPINKQTVVEEMSHVLISMQVVMRAYGIQQDELDAEFTRKLSDYIDIGQNGNI